MIRFDCEPNLHNALPLPVPAIKSAPQYFKNIKPQIDDHPANGTVKRCVPFLEALSAGFIIPLWADVFVRAKDGEIQFDFPQNYVGKESLGSHSYDQIRGHPLASKAYGKFAFKFINPWIVSTDDGVSCLFTSPLNHLETRIKILDGVVDTDGYYNNVNFPFIWTGGDGDFLIPKGTPLVQVIPFRRETHDVQFGKIEEERRQETVARLSTHMKNGYRSDFWHNRKSESESVEQ